MLAAGLPRDADDLSLRVLSPADAIAPMRQILARIGLTEKKRVVYKDGSLGVSWHEDPSLYIQQWSNQESAITLKSDAQGPVELRFFTRLATDTVKTVYRLGHAEAEDVLLRAFWDLGIRKLVAQFHRDRTPLSFIKTLEARYASKRGCTLILTQQSDGWIDQTMTMEQRP
jgi:hypothetical protein